MDVATLYLVRHAEAAGHEDDDPGLSDLGRSQAATLAERLADRPPILVMHGPRRRAAETAGIISRRLSLKAAESTLLDDRTPYPSAAQRGEYGGRFLRWLDQAAEDERDVDGVALDAAFSELSDLARTTSGRGAVLAVTHGFVIGWFVRHVLGAPTDRWIGLSSGNTGLTVVEYGDGRPRLISFNDTGHLG